MAQAATAPSGPVELQSFDTAYANVYRNPDGTLFSKVYFAPVNYKDKFGDFQHIDTDLQSNSNGTFGVTKNVFETQFGATGDSSGLDTVTYQGKKVSFSLVPTSMSAKMDSHTFTSPGHVKPTTNHNEIHYDGVYPSVSLQERVTNSGVKEAFVLNKYQPGLHSFAFVLNTDGVAPKIASDGSVHFVDQNGKTVFLIPHGIMQDSNVDPHSGDPQTSNAVTYGLQQIAGKTILTVSVDENWLADPSREYPVYIDPTIQASQISDAYVSSAYPTTNYSGSSLWNANQGYYDMHVGYYDSTTGTNWAYFQLPSVNSLPLLGLTVSSATFHAYCDWSYYASTAEPTSLFANTSSNWGPSTVTWNTTPSYTSTSISSSSTYRGQWASFNVTTLAQSWSNELAGSTSYPYDPTDGFFLSEAGAGQDHWHKFAASENSPSSGVQPYITINYNPPTSPYGGMYTHSDDKSGFVNLWWNPVAGAKSYNLYIFNGYNYQEFPLGNVTHWTSKGKHIWPTQSDIAAGKYQLYTDGTSGDELAKDPSQVYKNAYATNPTAPNYGSDTNYWFRIQAVAADGTTETGSDPFAPTMQDYVQVQDEGNAPTMVPLFVGASDGATGNFVLSETDLTTTGVGPQISISRTYNQNLSTQSGPFGNGWTMGYKTHIEIDNNSTYLVEPDGQKSLYWQQAGTNNYVSPPGETTWSLQSTTVNGSPGYSLTLDDKTVEYFAQVASGSNLYHLVKITDPNQNTLTLNYPSGSDQLSSMTDQSGRTTNIAYNADGTVQTITDFNNQTWNYGYTSSQLTSVTDPAGKVTRYGYTNGQLTSYTNPNGNTYTISYDASSGKVTGETNPAGKNESVTYTSGSVTFTDPLGIQTTRTYDNDHFTTQKVLDPTGLNRIWTYASTSNPYNEFGEATLVTDPRGGQTTYQYDEFGQITSVKDPNGHTVALTYTGTSTTGNVNTDVKDVNLPSGSYHFQYDSNHNRNVNQAPQGEKVNTTRNANGTPSMDVTVPADNPLDNNSFESWTNGIPTSWLQAGATHTNDPSSTSLFGGMSWGITQAAGTVELYPSSGLTPKGNGVAFGVYAKATTQAAANTTRVKINYFNSSGGYIGETDGPYLGSVNQWSKLTVTADPSQFPTGTVSYRPVIDTAPSGTDEVYFDAVFYNPSSEQAPVYNALANGNFDAQLNHWTPIGPVSVATDQVFLGDNYAAKITNPTGWSGIYPNDSNQYIPYVPNQPYYFGGFIKGNNAGNTYLALKFFDSNKTYLNEAASATLSGTFDWTHVFAHITSVPAGTAYIMPELLTNAASTGTVWADDLYLTLVPQNKSYGYNTDSTNLGNNLNSVTDPLGNQTQYGYDSENNVTSLIDPKGNTMSMTYDANHQMLTQTSVPDNLKVQNTYDNNGNITQIKETSSDGTTTYATKTSQYNNLDQLSSTTDALNHTTTTSYDASGRLTVVTLPDGHHLQMGYNNADEPTSVSVDGTVVNQSNYDGNGRLSSIQGGGVSTSYTRDPNENITGQTDSVGSQSFGYNGDNALTSSSFTVGSTTVTNTNTLNTEDQLVSITSGGSKVGTFGYNDANQVDSILLGNGMRASYKYDADHRVQEVIVGTSSNTLAAYGYGYDKNGNVQTITNEQTGVTMETYGYDAMNRLTEETNANGDTIQYTYDALGNLLQKTVTPKGGTATTTTYTYNAGNELTAVNGQAYTYDVNGNLTNDGNYTYKWNELGQLTEVDNRSGTPMAIYTYDALGRRVTEQAGGTTTKFFYQGTSNLVTYETDGSGNLLRSYTYSSTGLPLTMITWSGGTGTTYYYHENGHGDVIALTDSSGNTVAQYTYDSWGNILSSSGAMASVNPYRYAGYRFDTAVWMYYLNARYYKPDIMRFISQDPIDGMNLYVYADDNPVNTVDPSGTTPEDILFALWDARNLIRHPSLGNAGWLLFDAASTFVPAPTSEIAHGADAAMHIAHGNSKASAVIHHGYEISARETGDVVKTGISGRRLNKIGTSPRANSQVNRWNREAGYNKYTTQVVKTGIPGRQAAIEWERANAQRLWDEGNSMSRHQRPRPWE